MRAANRWSKTLSQHGIGDFLAALQRVVAVHQHLGLHDRHDAGLLAQRRVARQRFCIGIDRVGGRNARADIDHGAPFRESGAELVVLGESLAQAVESLGDGLTRESRRAASRRYRP